MGHKRNYAFDLLRIIACYFVIINHTNSTIFLTYYPSISGKISLFLFVLCKMGVPIFFMISGALLLKKEESYRSWFTHRILKFILIIIGISLLATIINDPAFLDSFNIHAFLQQVLEKPIYVPYWYLYTYLGIMIVLPFLRKMIKSFHHKDYILYLSIALFVSSLYPYISRWLLLPSISSYFITTIFSGPLLYFILGHYLLNIYVKERTFHAKKENLLGISVFLIASFSVYFLTAQEYTLNQSFVLSLDNAYLFPILCMSVTLFYLCYRNMESFPFHKLTKIFTWLSSYTFGIYLFHPIYIYHTDFSIVYSHLFVTIHPLLACFLYQFLLILCCLITTFIGKKIPYVKTLL